MQASLFLKRYASSRTHCFLLIKNKNKKGGVGGYRRPLGPKKYQKNTHPQHSEFLLRFTKRVLWAAFLHLWLTPMGATLDIFFSPWMVWIEHKNKNKTKILPTVKNNFRVLPPNRSWFHNHKTVSHELDAPCRSKIDVLAYGMAKKCSKYIGDCMSKKHFIHWKNKTKKLQF